MTFAWIPILALQDAPAQQPPGGPGSFIIIQMILIFVIIYFLLLRPRIKQEREHKERVSKIKKGDEVVTSGGIVGEVVHVKDDRITIRSGESRFVLLRDRVADIPSLREKADDVKK